MHRHAINLHVRRVLTLMLVVAASTGCIPFKKAKKHKSDDSANPPQAVQPVSEPADQTAVLQRDAQEHPVRYATTEMQSARNTFGITAFLKPEDLAPQNKVDFAAADSLAASLSKIVGLYDNKPTKSIENASTSHCEAQRNPKIVATKTTFTLFYDFDSTDCDNKDYASATVTPPLDTIVTSSRESYLLQVTCQDVDLSQYNGKLYSDLADLNFLNCSPSAGLSEQRFATTYKNGDGKIHTTTSVEYHGNPAMGPCVTTKQGANILFDDSCISVNIEDKIDDGSHTINYSRLSYHGLTRAYDKDDAVWYTGGQINLDYGYWSGVLTYRDAATAPTFSMSAPGKDTVTGSLTATADN